MMNWILVTLLMLLAAATILSYQDCTVSSRKKVKWVWSQMMIGVWVPPKITHDTSILQFEITFAGNSTAKMQDVIQVYRDFTNITIQESHQNFEIKNSESVASGWLNITLSICQNVSLTSASLSTVRFITYPIQHRAEEVIVRGSNVTVNCHSGKMSWEVEKRREVVPISETKGWHHFEVYSNHQVLPTLILGGKTLTLGWDNQSINNNSTHPLPPFTHHMLVVDCLDLHTNDVSCKIKGNLGMLVSVSLLSRPTFLVMISPDQNPFFLIQDTSALPPLAVTTGQPKVLGWSGWWVFVAVLLAILLAFVIIMCIVSHYHRPKIEKYLGGINFISEAIQEDVEIQLQPERRPMLMRSISLINTEDPKSAAPLRLWNAVASGEQEEVEQVLATLGPSPQVTLDGWDTSPYEEAHRRGHSSVLRVVEAFMHSRPDVPHNDMILGVLQAHTNKVDAVFEAASGGQYRYAGGVDVLLRAYSLPGTIQDQHGRSLLHYAASVMLADGGPLWLAPDIRSLVENHSMYVNAVDFKGCTALHALAEKASMSDRNTCWDGKALSVKEAWVNLASLIMSLGCDPRLPNHWNKYPHQVARECGNAYLANHLAKAVGNLGLVYSAEPVARFKDFVEASGTGNVTVMQDLMMKGVRVLPVGSHKDPLVEAIQGGHRDSVFLLLSAGAPLCAHGLVGNTPFETAHNTIGLPALFPALIRKAFCDRLQAEMEIIPDSDDLQNIMKDGMAYLKTIAEISGHKLGEELSTWLDRWPTSSSVNYTDMLAMAASSGLTLTCQLLGVAGVCLHPLPNHLHPLAQAVNNNHIDTAYSLCRDLKMNPYSSNCNLDNISEQLTNDLQESELQIFAKKLQKKDIGDSATKELLDYAKGVKEGENDKQTKTFLYLLAELSLVTILHRIRGIYSSIDINGIVHLPSGSTMLHIAASYGKINMVEYLLSQGVDHTCLTSGGLTAVHLAAVRGHKQCMEYMIEYTGNEIKCNIGLKPREMLQYFNENVRSCHLDLLSYQDISKISNVKGDHAKAKLILANKCDKLGIINLTSLWDNLFQEQKKMEGYISSEFEGCVHNDIQALFDKIKEVDERFVGKVVSSSPLAEKIELSLPENFEFYLELDGYNALKGGCISIKNMKGNEEQNGECIVGISSSQDQDLFIGANFRNSFFKATHEALVTASFKSLALVSPFVAHTPTGVCIYAVYRDKQRMLQLRIMLNPVLKAPRPHGFQLYMLPKRYQNHLESYTYEHVANTSEGNWIYMFNVAQKCIIAAVREEERIVLQACFYFIKLLSLCWWLPKQEQRHHGRSWKIYPVGVNVPSLRTLKSLFLEELVEHHEQSWDKEHCIERIVSVLKRTSYSRNYAESFILPSQFSGGIQAIIQFLQSLLEISNDKIRRNIIFNRK